MLININSKASINKDLVLNRMKVDKTTPSYKNICEVFNNQLKASENLIEIQNLCLVENNSCDFGIKILDDCEKIAYCFTSIGNKMSKKTNIYFNNNQYIEGYLLNAIADEMVMSLTRLLHSEILQKLTPKKYNMTKRFSPGECNFDISFQKNIMKKIKANFDIKARLNDSFMIIPEKSTLFVYGIDKYIPKTSLDHDCSLCTKENCPYRK